MIWTSSMTADSPSNGPHLPMGLLFAGSEMASFTIIGIILDFACGTMPWCTIGFTLLGTFMAFFQLTRMVKALNRKKPESSKGPVSTAEPEL